MGMQGSAFDGAALESQRFMVKVFAWMCAALAITAGVAVTVATSTALKALVFHNYGILAVCALVEFLLVMSLSWFIEKMPANVGTALFLLYAAVNGVTFSIFLLVYTAASIASAFFVTAGMFGVMALYGYLTRSDLTGLGSLCFMALIGIIIASIVNWFAHSIGLYWAITYIAVFVFTGLVAYDTQKIKELYRPGAEQTDEEQREAVMGALALYLDFINLFIQIVRIMGKRRD